MKTDAIKVDGSSDSLEKALECVESASFDYSFDDHTTRQLRLLTEETLELVKNITGGYTAEFCLDISKHECSINIKMNTQMSREKRERLIAESGKKDTAAPKGVSGRIRKFLETDYEDIEKDFTTHEKFGLVKDDSYDDGGDGTTEGKEAYMWSLQSFTMSAFDAEEDGDDQTWIDIGRSIVANLSDDIRIYIFRDSVDITIVKNITSGTSDDRDYDISPEFDALKKLPVATTGFQVKMIQMLYGGRVRKEKSDEQVQVKRIKIPSAHSPSGFIDTLVYTPQEFKNGEKAGCVVLYHGGAFVFPALTYHYRLARILAAETHSRVFMPMYDLAPKYVPPLQMEQAFSVYTHILDSADTYAVDKSRIAVVGDSAGGTLCAALSIMCIERGRPVPAAQVLLYPSLDARRESPSMKKYVDVPVVNAVAVDAYYKLCGFDGYKGCKYYNSPVEYTDFTGFPASYVEVAEYDCLRDDGILFADKLRDAGCDVVLNKPKGTVHAYDMIAGSEILKESMYRRVSFINEVFGNER